MGTSMASLRSVLCRGLTYGLCITPALLAALTGGVRADQGPAPVRFSVEGVDGDVRDNVEESVSLARRGGRISESEARELHERAPGQIRKAVEPFGFFRAAVRGDLEYRKGKWEASYAVDLGAPLRIDSVEVAIAGEGHDDPPFVRARRRIALRRGDVLLQRRYEEAKELLTTTAMRNGYIDGHFTRNEVLIDLERYRSTVVLHFDTGPLRRFGKVDFRQDVVDPELLRGYVTFRPGDPVDFDRLLELESSLGNSPYFSRVEVRPGTGTGATMPIVVDLVPAKRMKFTIGAGYGTDNGAHVRSIVELRRLNRRGHRAEVEGTLSQIEQSAAAKYIMPWPYPRTDVLTLSGGYSVMETETSTENTGFVGAGWSRLWAGWQQSLALHLKREKYEVGVDRGIATLLTPEANWSQLRTNDPVDPSNGRRLRFRASGASDHLLSSASYARLETEGRWIRTFARLNRLNGKLILGAEWSDDFRHLPPSARFFAGGSQSVRGYDYESLGPRDSLGNVIGGRFLAVGGVEYEYRFRRRLGAAVFYDVGNALASIHDRLAHGAGVGVRWRLPVGLARVDIAFPLWSSDHRPHFHLAIGPML